MDKSRVSECWRLFALLAFSFLCSRLPIPRPASPVLYSLLLLRHGQEITTNEVFSELVELRIVLQKVVSWNFKAANIAVLKKLKSCSWLVEIDSSILFIFASVVAAISNSLSYYALMGSRWTIISQIVNWSHINLSREPGPLEMSSPKSILSVVVVNIWDSGQSRPSSGLKVLRAQTQVTFSFAKWFQKALLSFSTFTQSDLKKAFLV